MSPNLTLQQIQAEFEYVRRTFFPRWDRQGEWIVEVVDDLDGARGSCNTHSKAIQLTEIPRESLQEILVHEITHAVTVEHHGKRWKSRMQNAAQRAELLGLTELAEQLKKQVAGYEDPTNLNITTRVIYPEIHAAVLDQPQATLDQIVTYIRRQYGLSEEMFLKRFKRSRAVYDRAQEEVRAEDERAKAFQAMTVDNRSDGSS